MANNAKTKTKAQTPDRRYRAVATAMGDALKYAVSVNQIDRAAASVFDFPRHEFPNDAITSTRASHVYEWILSLATHDVGSEQKAELLVEFSRGLTPDDCLSQVDHILTDNGFPSIVAQEQVAAFASRDLHAEVIKHAQDLFLQGNYFHAVFECAKAYNKQVRFKAASPKDGQALMLEVWGCEKGVLKVTECATETDNNVQDGIKFLSAGLMQSVRNPTAHEPAVEWPISRIDCLDLLSFMSFLYRKLDAAQYSPQGHT